MGRLEDLKRFKTEIEELLATFIVFEERWSQRYDLSLFAEDLGAIRLRISKLLGDVEELIRFCEEI